MLPAVPPLMTPTLIVVWPGTVSMSVRLRAQAADLLVVGEGEMHRHLEPGTLEGGDIGQAGGNESLHVAGAAAVEVAVFLLGEVPRIGRPGLAVDRHDVGVARQHDAA